MLEIWNGNAQQARWLLQRESNGNIRLNPVPLPRLSILLHTYTLPSSVTNWVGWLLEVVEFKMEVEKEDMSIGMLFLVWRRERWNRWSWELCKPWWRGKHCQGRKTFILSLSVSLPCGAGILLHSDKCLEISRPWVLQKKDQTVLLQTNIDILTSGVWWDHYVHIVHCNSHTCTNLSWGCQAKPSSQYMVLKLELFISAL